MDGTAARVRRGGALESLATICRNAAICLLALMSTLIMAQVVGRNLFGHGLPWADELSRLCGVALVFLTVPLLALRGEHVAVDMVPQLLPPAGRRLCAIIAELMVFAFSVITLWALWAFLSRAWKFATPTLGIPNWVSYAPAIIGFALLAAITTLRLITLFRGGEARPQAEGPLQ